MRQKFISSQFWRLEVQGQGVGRAGVFSPWLAGGISLGPHPVSSLACLHPYSLFLEEHWPHWIRVHTCIHFILLYLFKDLRLQMQSHPEVLGVRTSTCAFQGMQFSPSQVALLFSLPDCGGQYVSSEMF